jgi:hypothetical protein
MLIKQNITKDSKVIRVIDAFENRAVADYLELIHPYPKSNEINVCEVLETECSSLIQFNRMVNLKFGFKEDTKE